MPATDLFGLPKLSLFAFHNLRFHPLPLRPKPSPPSLRLPLRPPNRVPFRSNYIFKMNVENSGCMRGLEIDADEIPEMGDLGLPVELCMTQSLPPALSLQEGFDKIKEAVEKLKADPPLTGSGVLRFQVVVPPSTNAFSWFCCQHKELFVYPQFYLLFSYFPNPSLEFASLNGGLETFGTGAAIYIHGSSNVRRGYNLMSRYLSIDSPLIWAYGFLGMNYDDDSSSMEEKPGSFYFLIPQIELNKFEGCSLLASTVVWDDSLSYTFTKAVDGFELYVKQVMQYVPWVSMYNKGLGVNFMIRESSFIWKKDLGMVCLNADVLTRIIKEGASLQQEQPPTCYQSFFKHSSKTNIVSNMHNDYHGNSFSIEESTNINAVWASLIVEECVRLGLTYFCIAPGSRSSPLAMSACSHPCTTCISCFDERSLAFHAVGYARGSHKPAVVITSSGTAVSNLLPAVVEASHDFLPLMLLTADRPPELLEAGANQAIDQVNHFGKFVRFFFSLPPPCDEIPARMVLTTVDSAAYNATRAPYGPVHINCPFREPLDNSPREWKADCLRGLLPWLSNSEPYTKYTKLEPCGAFSHHNPQIIEIVEVIQRANRGLLLIGSIHTEDEIMAAAILAKHLSWPVVTDILSGLRIRRLLASFPEMEELPLFIDHMDHSLLSDSIQKWVQPDVVLQIGSKFTSKRIGQQLELCSPSSYILVDKHPYRHDPSHIVTHRLQSTILNFTYIALKYQFPIKVHEWRSSLKMLDSVVAQEIAFQVHSEDSLSEPYVAHVIGEALKGDAALFVGNSMVIRDLDFFGRGYLECITDNMSFLSYCNLQFHGFQVVGNRGASGIDGLLSTAIGFAVGCNKRVLCLIGDISFLHDTNGLSILNQRVRRKPITVLVINNHGGGIFSLLPIADRAPLDVLSKYFYTVHNISIEKLCAAYSVKHILVQTKMELQDALCSSQQECTDCVIEVESSIAKNAKLHRIIGKFASQAANQALHFLLGLSNSKQICNGLSTCKIHKVEYSLYRIQLSAIPTSSQVNDLSILYREGFVLSVFLDDKSIGFGEVAPIEIHEEDLLDVEEQLRFLLHVLEGATINFLPLLKGSFSNWIWRNLGIPPSSIFASVRCGMEMAILNALAARYGCSLFDVITGCWSSSNVELVAGHARGLESIQICALVDSNGSPKEVAHIVSKLLDEGFTTVKLKVARRENPINDAIVIKEIREKVGFKVKLRVDANRRWTYEEAIQFGSRVKYFDLQFIEEPVCYEDDIINFCVHTGLPVALDETIDKLKGEFFEGLQRFVHPGVVAIVIKPSIVGGFENAALISKWAQMHDKMVVVSGAFESSLSLSAYIQFAYYLEHQNAAICRVKQRKVNATIAHGLGTFRWLKEDVTATSIKICKPPQGESVEASIQDAKDYVRHFQINQETVQRIYTGEQLRSYSRKVEGEGFSCLFKLQEAGSSKKNKTVVYLHGFLGTSDDWIPIMKSMSDTAHCISIDLPGHGETQYQRFAHNKSERLKLSIELVADLLLKLISDVTYGGVTLVGYSMGARIALYMALNYKEKITGAIIMSGSPGLRDEAARRIRHAQDEARARFLLSHGLNRFLQMWYSGILWRSLRDHPHYRNIASSRTKHSDIEALAETLSSMSIGNQASLWEDLKYCRTPVLFIVGEKDAKFRKISQQMCSEINCSPIRDHNEQKDFQDASEGEKLCEMVVVPNSGHAVHLENPLLVINAVRKFLIRLEKR